MRRIDVSRDIAGLLASVERPGRYVGGEYGQIVKDGAGLRVAVSFPDLYEIGMSNAAVKILYALFNAIPDVSCERVFAPAPDFEAALRARALPLFSLETGTVLADFHVLGFSVGFELTMTNLCAILELGGVSLLSKNRGDDEPIVMGGGPAVTNPAPWGRFLDCVFIGEAEAAIPPLFADLAAMKRSGARRADLLSRMAQHPSIWMPAKAGQVFRSIWRGFSGGGVPSNLPVPSIRTVQDHGTVEIMRGCPNACRFCHAGCYYRPSRVRDRGVVEKETAELVFSHGYREITLASLSSGDYPGIHAMVGELNARFRPFAVSFSLPSLRVDSLALELLGRISEVRKSGLTFAVETAKPDWQKELRKNVPVERIVEILLEAKRLGWKGAKFYFMVGLPASFQEDETGPIIEFLQTVKRNTGIGINVNIATFIPKPHTPYERAPQLSEEEALRRIMLVKHALGRSGFKIGYHSPFLSLLEGILSRGDERAGDLVLDAYRRGARLDAWEEHMRPEIWREAIAAAGWDVAAEACRERRPDESLPWSSVSLAVDPAADAPTGAPAPSAAAMPSRLPAQQERFERILFSFSKEGKAVFLSHLDLMTIFERALMRAGYDCRFSQGFNPKPKLEFAHPLSLGIASLEEVAAVELYNWDGEPEFMRRMDAALPEGLEVASARPAAPGKSLMALFGGAEYRMTPRGAAPEADAASAMESLKAAGLSPVEDAGGIRVLFPPAGISLGRLAKGGFPLHRFAVVRLHTHAKNADGNLVSYFELPG